MSPDADPEVLPDATETETGEKANTKEGHVYLYNDLGDFSDLGGTTVYGSKELKDDDPEGETSSMRPTSASKTIPHVT